VVIFEKIRDGVKLPERGTSGAACWDLRSDAECILYNYGIVGTGLKVRIPDGHVGLVCSRSGLAAKHGIFVLNSPGVIDCDYRGELKVILGVVPGGAFKVEKGERMAQLMVIPIPTMEACFGTVNDDTERGDKGLGSTGSH
jgi:dUTP pyrophosphatase